MPVETSMLEGGEKSTWRWVSVLLIRGNRTHGVELETGDPASLTTHVLDMLVTAK
jgi:hypothetical protein